jgi:4-hydroxyproline epimerase
MEHEVRQSGGGSGARAGFPSHLRVIDSHTEGEPTRVVIDGWPPLEGATMMARRDDLVARWDLLRQAVVCEPRGHEAMVGALLTPPVSPDAVAGVVFFNNVAPLGMCGHGLIGVVRTLAHLGQITPGSVRLDTPVGPVGATLHDDLSVTIENVPAYRHAQGVPVTVPELGEITGDVAWGGNWFFITHLPQHALTLDRLDTLLGVTRRILAALEEQGVRGAQGALIDHVELTGPSDTPGVQARNFVLCPGGEYDRSPCGTGTSAKLAVLAAEGRLQAGERWTQESITGGRFTGWLEGGGADEGWVPRIHGRAWVIAESTLHFDETDLFRYGFSPHA